MNVAKALARLGLAAVTVAVIAMIVMAFVPLTQNGISVSGTEGLEIGIEQDPADPIRFMISANQPIVIHSDMPYDFERVGLSMSLDAGDGVSFAVYEQMGITLKKGEETSLQIEGDFGLLDTIMVLSYYNGQSSEEGIAMPMSLRLQGYYMAGMLGASVEVSMEVPISSTGTVTLDSEDPKVLSCRMTGLEGSMFDGLPDGTHATILGQDGGQNIEVNFSVPAQGTLEMVTSTVGDLYLAGALRGALNEDGTMTAEVTVPGDPTETFTITAEDAADLIAIVEAIYGTPAGEGSA